VDVIPVIDVAHGRVVRAVKGKRSGYLPIETPLSPSCEPADVAMGLAKVFPFQKLYVADLDGIEGRGRNTHLVQILSKVLPRAEIWIDAGTGSRSGARSVLAAPVATLVVGTESIETVRVWEEISAEAPSRTVLSLDFRHGEFMGPEAMLSDSSLWPSRVVVMTLDRVGANNGPDIDRLEGIVSRSKGRLVYAAGGVRDRRDLAEIQKVVVAGALIASALHSGKISADDIKHVAGR
jgi:phosphoribosylformimino-5-aminoimidazole carboxamide ribotide isomerase